MAKSYLEQCIEAQEKYAKENRLPNFAPPDGKCYSCRQIIYGIEPNRIRLDRASSQLITGCPLCNRTYCD